MVSGKSINSKNFFAFERTKLHPWQKQENATYEDIFTGTISEETSEQSFEVRSLISGLTYAKEKHDTFL